MEDCIEVGNWIVKLTYKHLGLQINFRIWKLTMDSLVVNHPLMYMLLAATLVELSV